MKKIRLNILMMSSGEDIPDFPLADRLNDTNFDVSRADYSGGNIGWGYVWDEPGLLPSNLFFNGTIDEVRIYDAPRNVVSVE